MHNIAPHTILRCLVCGLVVGLTQIAFVTGMGTDDTFAKRLDSLIQWDSDWYRDIQDFGYVSDIPPKAQDGAHSNVGFFPAYPLASHVFKQLTGVTSEHAMIGVSWLGCIVFWMAYFLFMANRAVAPPYVWYGCGSIFCFYPAFYMTVGYSESLLMGSALLFLWATDRAVVAVRAPTWQRFAMLLVACGAGCVMTATRLVGLGLVGVPLVASYFASKPGQSTVQWLRQEAMRPIIISVCASLGGLGFFYYCHARWGVWDLYLQTQKIGWNRQASISALLSWRTYFQWAPDEMAHLATFTTHSLNRLAVTGICLWGVTMIAAEILLAARLPAHNWHSRLTLYLSAWLTFAMSVTSSVGVGFDGCSRYALVPFVLLVCATLALAQAYNVHNPQRALGYRAHLVWFVLIFVSLSAQLKLAGTFLSGKWIE